MTGITCTTPPPKLSSRAYTTEHPVDKVFTVEGENCGESVFELQCESTDASKNSDVIGQPVLPGAGVRGAGEWDLGWGWHMGTTLVGQAFEAGDPRKDASLLYFRRSISEPVTPENTNKPYGGLPYPPQWAPISIKKRYIHRPNCVRNTPKTVLGNIRIIRYPDVLLMAAEAANEKGIPGEAIDYLEQVRAHARGTDSSILPKVTSTDQSTLREAIRHERRVELALEPDRFYRPCTLGHRQEVLQAAGKNYQDKTPCCRCRKKRLTNRTGTGTESQLLKPKLLSGSKKHIKRNHYKETYHEEVFRRTSLLLAAVSGAATMQAQKSPQDYGPLYRCADKANDRRRENRPAEPSRHR